MLILKASKKSLHARSKVFIHFSDSIAAMKSVIALTSLFLLACNILPNNYELVLDPFLHL